MLEFLRRAVGEELAAYLDLPLSRPWVSPGMTRLDIFGLKLSIFLLLLTSVSASADGPVEAVACAPVVPAIPRLPEFGAAGAQDSP